MEQLLRHMQTCGASDLVLTTGAPPQFRINGLLNAYGSTALEPDDTQRLIYSLLTPEQVQQLEDTRYLDFSKELVGHSRFRVSVFFQKDALAVAIRLIPYDIPPFESLGVPEMFSGISKQ